MKKILLLFLVSSSVASAQDLTGTWEGYGPWSGASYVKLVLMTCNGQYIGYSFDSGPGFCQANFAGTYNETTKRLRGENKGMIRKTFEHTQSSFNLTYRKDETGEYLEGNIGAKSSVFQVLTLGLGSPLKIKKVSNSIDTTEFMRGCIPKSKTDSQINRKEIPILTPQVSNRDTVKMETERKVNPVQQSISELKETRTNDTVATVFTKGSVIHISMYDNGQIDGDTITVFHNNKIIADRIGVTALPYKFKIVVDDTNPYHDIVLVANNLGSIPPNTAVLVIDTGDKKYNLFASSDLKKNSLVIFKLENR